MKLRSYLFGALMFALAVLAAPVFTGSVDMTISDIASAQVDTHYGGAPPADIATASGFELAVASYDAATDTNALNDFEIAIYTIDSVGIAGGKGADGAHWRSPAADSA